jgi:hypothetical protein
MLLTRKFSATLLAIFFISQVEVVTAQDEISWLSDFTEEMIIGKETFRYSFSNVDGNACKVEIQESVTGKKGESETRSWIFYLSDIDSDNLSFNARGKSIRVNMNTINDQDFISYYEAGEFEEYTDGLELLMNEVDMTRSFIEALREHMGPCNDAEAIWEERDAAFDWLTEHVGEATEGDVKWEQALIKNEKPYLAMLSSQSVNSKGEEESFEYLFDLSDIQPRSIKLEASGKSLSVQVPVREGRRYIEVNTQNEKEFIDELSIYFDDIEVARQTVHALSYLVSNTEPVRPEWSGFNEALDFVTRQLGEVKVGDKLYQHTLQYDLFTSDILNLTVRETDADGSAEDVTYSFYPADMTDKPGLEVSRRDVSIELNSKEGVDYIMKITDGSVSGYASRMEILASGIDEARDLMKAMEYIIQNSEEELESFESAGEVNAWLEDNLEPLFRKGETYEQKIVADETLNNQLVFERKLTEDESEVTETTYLFYPEDLNLDEMKIQVRLGKLAVRLETAQDDYIRYVKNGDLQNFTDDTEVYFSDPLVARNFMVAIRFLKEHASNRETTEMSIEEAYSFVSENTKTIELSEETHEQSLEQLEGDPCKLKFTRVENEKEGKSDEYIYEFMASDFSDGNSSLTVEGKLIGIQLETDGGEDLIKPYKNGEVENFTDEFVIYADDVLLAKQILKALNTLSKACQ